MSSAKEGQPQGFSEQLGENRPEGLLARWPDRFRDGTTTTIEEVFLQLGQDGTEAVIRLGQGSELDALGLNMLVEVLRRARSNAQRLGQEAKIILSDPAPGVCGVLRNSRLLDAEALVIEYTDKQTLQP